MTGIIGGKLGTSSLEKPMLTADQETEYKERISKRFWDPLTQKYIKEQVGNLTGIERRDRALNAAREDIQGSNLLQNTKYSNYHVRSMQWLEELIDEWLAQNPEPN